MASTLTSMAEVSARLRADDTPTPPATRDETPTPDATSSAMRMSNSSTPTRHSFAGISGQRPLPDQFVSTAVDGQAERMDSTQPAQDQDEDYDVDMGDADTVVDEDGSDNESVTSDAQRPSKKKKGQRFFCTDFPPCQLSFTRSEHLARHIRKHTGERPFQCHCSRRFSRLDNLRQHAQTVHVNEEIPGDSLAATSTRFQRQIRTDRVRPTSSRSRGSTLNGGQTPTRGHSRNVSTSNIASVASTFTMLDERRHPPTLVVATDGLKRSHEMSEGYHNDAQHYHSVVNTPTSQSFSSLIGNPGFASPSSAMSRSSLYNGNRHSRRLSVPFGQQSSQPAYAPGYYTPSHASNYSQNTSGYASPTSSIMSPGRQDFETDIEHRRRTWHPSTRPDYLQRPATSGLSYHQTPDEPVPALSEQPAANQVTRLPGIESFDHAPPLSNRTQTDSMMLDAMSRPTSSTFESGIQQGFNRLAIAGNGPPEPQWQQSQPLRYQHHISMPEVPVTPRRNKRQAWYGGPVGPSTTSFQPSFGSHRPSPEDSSSSDGGAHTPLNQFGQEYHPAIANQHDPHNQHPTIFEHQAKSYQFPAPAPSLPLQQYGYPYSSQQKPAMPPRADSGLGPFSQAGPMTALSQQAPHSQTYHLQAGHDTRFANGQARPEQQTNDMGRLEALVAVATSENLAEKQR